MMKVKELENKIEQYRKEGFPKVWVADQQDGTYSNPVIHADYSDPDVIRVGDEFFMVASSFNCCPGFPLLQSNDLVNWKLINYVIKEVPYEEYDKPQHGKGVWAPSIRYHDGYFWVFVGMPDEGIFMSKTKDIYGTWEPLHCVKETRGWIDTCPFWDEDGQAYLVNGFAKSRIGFKSVLGISKMSPDGRELSDEFRIVIDGNINHPTIEGPKMYKRNGYYYISAPAGGVATGYQVVLRSKQVYGPYEEKIVLHQGDSIINGPHQGGWVDINEEESWFMHFQDCGAYGRIIHLQPMHWEEDWPVIGIDTNQDGIGEPVIRHKKPSINPKSEVCVPVTSDDFEEGTLGLQWQWHANPKSEWFHISDSNIKLNSIYEEQGVKEGLWSVGNLLLQKFPARTFKAVAKLDVSNFEDGDMGGLVVIGLSYDGIFAKCNELQGKKQLQLVRISGYGSEQEELQKEICSVVNEIYLKLEVDKEGVVSFAYGITGQDFIILEDKFTSTEGKWIGAKFGLGCTNYKKQTSGHLICDWFLVEE